MGLRIHWRLPELQIMLLVLVFQPDFLRPYRQVFRTTVGHHQILSGRQGERFVHCQGYHEIIVFAHQPRVHRRDVVMDRDKLPRSPDHQAHVLGVRALLTTALGREIVVIVVIFSVSVIAAIRRGRVASVDIPPLLLPLVDLRDRHGDGGDLGVGIWRLRHGVPGLVATTLTCVVRLRSSVRVVVGLLEDGDCGRQRAVEDPAETLGFVSEEGAPFAAEEVFERGQWYADRALAG
jgi:hypothetical protein